MIVETSALIAMALNEPECELFTATIEAADARSISAVSYLETGIVLDSRRNAVLSRQLDALLLDLELGIEPVTATQAIIARQAYRDFGRGSGHPAQLNFGDCLSYALAKDKREPLLYKGNDFVHTDIESAV
jgi:ribonuclease VapC